MFAAITPELLKVIESTANLPGWCQPDKSLETVRLILNHKPQVIVEIGVYCGRWFLPAAIAVAHNGFGRIHGIDPWAVAAVVEGGAVDEDHHSWWKTHDMESIYQQFKIELERRGLSSMSEIIRERSEVAVASFADDSVDMLHLDGNHSELVSTRDVTIWLPKVKPEGMLIIDDSSWASVANAVGLAKKQCNVVRDHGHWMVLQKR